MVIELKKSKEWINRMIRKIFNGASVYSITRYIYFKKGEKSFATARDQDFVKDSKLEMIRKRKWVKTTARWRHWKENWTRVFEKSKNWVDFFLLARKRIQECNVLTFNWWYMHYIILSSRRARGKWYLANSSRRARDSDIQLIQACEKSRRFIHNKVRVWKIQKIYSQ